MTEWVKADGYQDNPDEDKPRFLTREELADIERKLNDKSDSWYFPAPLSADSESAELSRQNAIKFILVSLEEVPLCPSAVNELLSRTIEAHHKRIISPGSPVGNTAAEAVGASTTQMTLNSVAPWEELLIQDSDGVGHTVKIGTWIDELLEKYKDKIVHIPENRTQYLELEKPVKIVTSDNDGHVTWEDVTAVTKHIPVGNLVKIKTKSGREVTATQQKSFLIWDEKIGKLIETNGSDLMIGDLVPIANQIPDPPFVYTELDLKKYLSPKEWMYTSEMKEVQRRYDEYGVNKTGVWKQPGILDNIPQSRGDSFQEGYRNLEKHKLLENNYIFPKIWGKSKNTKIPEKIPLDKKFGQIVGLYLAEGWATDTFVGISNNAPEIRKLVYDWCENLGITHHTVSKTTTEGLHQGTSNDVKIHSVLFARLFKKWTGTGSAEKIMPEEILFGNREFIIGVLDGYFSGDGCVNKDNGCLAVGSVSRNLIDNTIFLCSRLGIFAKKSGLQQKKNNKGSQDIKYMHTCNIRANNADVWADLIGSCHNEKAMKMRKIYTRNVEWGRGYRKHENIMLDPIVRIDYVSNEEIGEVYDLTVPSTLNFCLKNSLVNRDTFHNSGQQKSASFGIDAMRDIILARKTPKNESCTIYYRKQAITYEEVLNSRQYIVGSMIADFIANEGNGKKYEIKSPNDLERKWWHDEEGLFDDELPDSKRVLRLHLNLVEMYKHRVTIEDLALILKRKTYSPKQEIPSGIVPRYGPMADAIIDLYPTADIYKILADKMDKFSVNNIPQDLAETTFLETIVYPELDKIRVKGLAGIKNLYPRIIPVWSIVLSEKRLEGGNQDDYVLYLNDNVMRAHGFEADNLVALCEAAGIIILLRPDEYRIYIKMPLDRYRTSKNQEVIRIGNSKYIKLDKKSLKLFQNQFYELMDDKSFSKRGEFYYLEVEKESSKVNWIEEKIPAAIEQIPSTDVINIDNEYYRLVRNLVSIIDGEERPYDGSDNMYQLYTVASKIKITEMKPGEYVAAKIAEAKKTYKADVDAKTNEILKLPKRIPVNLQRPYILRASELIIADTDGSNFRELLALRVVDKKRTTCNNMHTIAETIGIEAARTFIIRQLQETIKNTGSYIHPAHILFIAEFITSRGVPYGATYTGISKQPHGPLSLATVERAGKTFTQNALFGRKEDIRNVSASVAVGVRMAVGNGMFDIAQNIIENGKEITLINDDVFDFSKRDDNAKLAEEQRIEKEQEEERNRLFAPTEETETEIDTLDDPIPIDNITPGYFPSNTGKINISALKAKPTEETEKQPIISTGLVTTIEAEPTILPEEQVSAPLPKTLDDLFKQYQANFIANPEYYSRERLPTVTIPITNVNNTNLQRGLLAARQEQYQGLTFLG